MESKKDFTRRDFLKVSGVLTTSAIYLSHKDILRASAESLMGSEKDKITDRAWFNPRKTLVIGVPVRKDWTRDDFGSEKRNPFELTLDGGVLEARHVREISVNGLILKVGEIPFTGGNKDYEDAVLPNADQYAGLAILEIDGKNSYEIDNSGGKILSGFTAVLGESQTPTEVWNILQAGKNLLKFQSENGGLKDGDYSFLKIQASGQDFRTNEEGYLTPGVGATATLLSKSLYPLTQSGKAEFTNRQVHPAGLEYFDGPFSPEITEVKTDATVDIDDDRLGKRDFSFRLKGLGKVYLWVDAVLVPDPGLKTETKKWHKYPAGVRLVYTFTLRKSPPPADSEKKIEELQEIYTHLVEGNSTTAKQVLSLDGTQKTSSWERTSPIIDVAFPEFVTKDFTLEIGGADKGRALPNIKSFLASEKGKSLEKTDKRKLMNFYYSLIYYFADGVTAYNKKYPYTQEQEKKGLRPKVDLGPFLADKMRADGIYDGVKGLTKSLEHGFWEIKGNTYLRPDQSIQCLIWVSFLGGLGLPISPTYVGGTGADTASGLVTPETREALKHTKTYVDQDRAELFFARTDTIKDVQIGDSFVRYGADNNHIGTVIGKKTVDGETVVLVTDANRKNDGVIRIFEVNKDNFRVIFGDPESPFFPIVIRNKKVQDYLR